MPHPLSNSAAARSSNRFFQPLMGHGCSSYCWLSQAILNPDVNIQLAGGTLNLGSSTHSLGALTATGSVLDFASPGNAKVNFTSVDVSSGAALSVTNWSRGNDLFAAANVVGNPVRNTMSLVPINRITFAGSGYATHFTNWRTVQNEITPIPPNPMVRVTVISTGGVGSFRDSQSGLDVGSVNLTTTTAGVPVTSAVFNGSTLQAASITQTGAVLTLPAAKMIAGADITCTFSNDLGTVLSGKVFGDGGAPSGGLQQRHTQQRLAGRQ